MAWMGWAVVALAVAGAGDGSPEPWETVATFVVMKPASVGIGAGVIVESGDRRSILEAEHRTVILTSGRFLGPQAANVSSLHPYTSRIDVSLYPGRLVAGTNTLHGASERVEGKLLAYDRESDLALISIPRWGLDASPLVAEGRDAKKANEFRTIGHRDFQGPSVEGAEIVPRAERMPDGQTPRRDYRGLVCRWNSKSWCQGSGLFDGDGNLMGICRDVDMKEGRAYFAEAKEIRAFLERNGIDTHGTKDRGRTESLMASGEAKVKTGMRAGGLAELEEASRRLQRMSKRIETLKAGLEFP